MNDIAEKDAVRDTILLVEDMILKAPGAMKGDCFPLKHKFVDGAYVREIFMPKGAFVVSKIHKFKHPYFILKGKGWAKDNYNKSKKGKE